MIRMRRRRKKHTMCITDFFVNAFHVSVWDHHLHHVVVFDEDDDGGDDDDDLKMEDLKSLTKMMVMEYLYLMMDLI